MAGLAAERFGGVAGAGPRFGKIGTRGQKSARRVPRAHS
jgi:hypothetical protein